MSPKKRIDKTQGDQPMAAKDHEPAFVLPKPDCEAEKQWFPEIRAKIEACVGKVLENITYEDLVSRRGEIEEILDCRGYTPDFDANQKKVHVRMAPKDITGEYYEHYRRR